MLSVCCPLLAYDKEEQARPPLPPCKYRWLEPCRSIFYKIYLSTPAGSLQGGLTFLACSLNLSSEKHSHLHSSHQRKNPSPPFCFYHSSGTCRVWWWPPCPIPGYLLSPQGIFWISPIADSAEHFLLKILSFPPNFLMNFFWLMSFTQSLPISTRQDSVLGPLPFSFKLLSDFIHGHCLWVPEDLYQPFNLWLSVSYFNSYLVIHLWGVHVNLKTDMSNIK